METFSALLAICAGNSPVPGEFPAQRPVTRSFDVFFDLRLNKRLSKQSRGWWFETLSLPLWRHRNHFIDDTRCMQYNYYNDILDRAIFVEFVIRIQICSCFSKLIPYTGSVMPMYFQPKWFVIYLGLTYHKSPRRSQGCSSIVDILEELGLVFIKDLNISVAIVYVRDTQRREDWHFR